MKHTILASFLAGLILSGCGGSATTKACGPAVREALDPNSLVHVLPGAPVPNYLTDPPTSGAHQPAPPIKGPRTKPIDPQIQVGLLEEGRVLIQYRDLAATDVQSLDKLNGTKVITAPNPDLPGNAHVVATSWLVKMQCDAFDDAALQDFIAQHADKGPAQP